MNIIGGVLEFTIDLMGMTFLVILSLAALAMFGWVLPFWWLINKSIGLIPESPSPLTLLLMPVWAMLSPLATLAMASVWILQDVVDRCPGVFEDLVYTFKSDPASVMPPELVIRAKSPQRTTRSQQKE